MSTFTYKALDARGMAAGGQVDRDRQGRRGRRLASPGPHRPRPQRDEARHRADRARRCIKPKDLTIFSRQFATMVNSGLSHAACSLRPRGADAEQEARKGRRRGARRRRGGHIPCRTRLEKHPKVFSRLYVSMVRAGEVGGILDIVLNRLATQLEKEDSIRRAVKSAMVYPVVIGVFAILVLFGMVMFLIPIFAGMYNDLGDAQLPLLTRMMVGLSEIFLRSWWGLVILGVIILLSGRHPAQAHREGRHGVGPLQAAHPDGDRTDRAASSPSRVSRARWARSSLPACPSCRPSRSPARQQATP